MRTARALVASLLLAGLAVAAASAADAPKDLHVFIVSIDALRPEFYLRDDFETPTLKALAAKGARARGVEPAYPSVTYAGHASIVTGKRPAGHGIIANTVFDPEKGAQPEWLWEAKTLTAKPLWLAAREQGRKVAILMWPTTVGAQVDWLVPERWGVRGDSTRDLLLKHSTKGLLMEVALALGVSAVDSASLREGYKIDEFVSGAAAHVIETRKPNLLLIHLIQVDHEAHSHGRDAAEVKTAVKRVDGCIAKLVEAARKVKIADRTVFAIVGDHGFTDVKQTIAPNTLLAKAGLVTLDGKNQVTGWRALGHAHGGSMAIYAKDADAARDAHAVLAKGALANGEALYRIIERAELDALGADPKAAFWLEAAEEKALAGEATGELVWAPHELRGTHGGLPTRKQLHTGFILSGPGVRATTIDRMRLIDIAPTLAKLMGVDLPDTDGGVLDVLDEQPY